MAGEVVHDHSAVLDGNIVDDTDKENQKKRMTIGRLRLTRFRITTTKTLDTGTL